MPNARGINVFKHRILKGNAVQRIGWILAVLLSLGWVASEIPLQNASSNDRPRVETAWRRTVDGWENASQWSFYSFTSRPALHPFYLGMMQCAAVAWIVLFLLPGENHYPERIPTTCRVIIKKASLLETKLKAA